MLICDKQYDSEGLSNLLERWMDMPGYHLALRLELVDINHFSTIEYYIPAYIYE